MHGAIALRQALTVSSDVFFYLLGQDMNNTGHGQALQRWAHRLGIGRETGIDLPEEGPGFLPTEAWRDRANKQFERCKERNNYSDAQIAAGTKCGFIDRPWSVGDNINLSVGQGDLQANPLQMAVAYATIANAAAGRGGRVLRPRLGQRIENSLGQAEQNLEAPTARKLAIDREGAQAIMEGLNGAAEGPGGTSTSVFEGFPIEIAGKTGTAEKGFGRADQSWYCALAPYPDPKYVVCATDEAGGFGADTAAPMVRLILVRAVQRGREPARGRRGRARLMAAVPVQDFQEQALPRFLRLDPLLLLATLGLVAASVYFVRGATLDDVAGDPNYFMYRQLVYVGVGLVLMLVVARFDYSRLREWRWGVYGFMIGSIVLVYLMGATARGSKRAIEFGFFNFQASELGKVLLVVALAAFAVDRTRRLGEPRPPAASCCSRSSRRCS